MTAASNSEATRHVVENGWLAEVVDGHTCGTRPGGHFGLHEPGCGLVPVARIDDLLAAHAAQAIQAPLSRPIPAPVDSGAIGRLNEAERAQIDERVAADHWGYYLHFEATSVPEVDRILSAVGLAAKAYHHTDGWNDDLDWDYGPIPKGETCADFIQRVAEDSANLLREHTDRALAEVEQRIEAAAWFVFDDEDVDPEDEFVRRADALAIVRAARQEQGLG